MAVFSVLIVIYQIQPFWYVSIQEWTNRPTTQTELSLILYQSPFTQWKPLDFRPIRSHEPINA